MMLFSQATFQLSLKAMAAIIATRVQLGTPSVDFSEESTRRGYAYMIGLKNIGQGKSVASVIFPPDPVCAAIAMGLMTEMLCLLDAENGNRMHGLDARLWVKEIDKIYDARIFTPDREDAGEVLTAFYLLLCGDELRFKNDNFMRKFEINLNDFLKRLSPKLKAKLNAGFIFNERCCDCKVNFIQVCQNHFCSDSWTSQISLEMMYDMAVGVNLYNHCSAMDMVFSIKRTLGKNEKRVFYHFGTVKKKNET